MILIVDEKLVNYIRTNKAMYSIDRLKTYLIQQGYSPTDVDAAARIALGKSNLSSSQKKQKPVVLQNHKNQFKTTAENKQTRIDAIK